MNDKCTVYIQKYSNNKERRNIERTSSEVYNAVGRFLYIQDQNDRRFVANVLKKKYYDKLKLRLRACGWQPPENPNSRSIESMALSGINAILSDYIRGQITTSMKHRLYHMPRGIHAGTFVNARGWTCCGASKRVADGCV